jgi:HSP20 family protein
MTIVKYFKPAYFPFNGNSFVTSGILNSRSGEAPESADFRKTMPGANVFESDSAYRIQLALPGIRKQNIGISLNKDVLTVTVSQQDHDGGTYTLKEYDYAAGERSFFIPDTVATEKISSSLENGILSLLLPKKESAIPKGPVDIQIN